MKYLRGGFFAACITALAVGGYAYRPEAAALASAAAELYGRTMYPRDVRFYGLQLVSRKSLEDIVPQQKSNLWWQINSNRVARMIEEQPMIARAAVVRCSSASWNCFKIAVEEREPAALVRTKDGAWVVDASGAYLKPVSADAVERAAEQELLPVLGGVDISPLQSPELTRARTGYVVKAIAGIESSSGRKVIEASMRPNGELAVRFSGLRLLAIFDAAEKSLVRLTDEARRLRLLLDEFKGRENAIELVDLAYNTSAVVRLFGARRTM